MASTQKHSKTLHSCLLLLSLFVFVSFDFCEGLQGLDPSRSFARCGSIKAKKILKSPTAVSSERIKSPVNGDSAPLKNTLTRSRLIQAVCRASALVSLGLLQTTSGQVANAAVENNNISSQLAFKSALRNVKSAQRTLKGMKELYVDTDDYAGIKQALRVEPFSVLRKSCTTLIRENDQTNSGKTEEELMVAYRNFIVALEKLDSIASLAIRGRTFSGGEFITAYNATVDNLEDFVKSIQSPLEQPLMESYVE